LPRVQRQGCDQAAGLSVRRHGIQSIVDEVKVGLAIGVDLVSDRASREPVPVTTTAKVIFRAYQLGAVCFYVGMRGNVLEFTLSLILSEAEADDGVAIVDQAMTDVTRGLVSDKDVAPFMMWCDAVLTCTARGRSGG
jgi:4-aminobutyrate aminotransferase